MHFLVKKKKKNHKRLFLSGFCQKVLQILVSYAFHQCWLEFNWQISFFLFCRYPCQNVFCTEQSLSGPGQSARDNSPDGHEQELDSEQHKVCVEYMW